MQQVSQDFRRYIRELDSAAQVVWLLTLSHAGVVREPRLCSHDKPVTLDGETYLPSPVTLRMPTAALLRGRTDGRLRLENVTRSLIQWIRVECVQQPEVAIAVVLLTAAEATADPVPPLAVGRIEYGPVQMRVGKTNYRAEDMTLPLVMSDLFKRPFQDVNFDPARAPALFV